MVGVFCVGVFCCAALAVSSGCVSAVSAGISLVGRVVDDADVKDHAGVLIGQNVTAADERFGKRIDIMREVDGPRTWHIYPVSNLNFLGKDRYVVEVRNNEVIALTRAETTSDPKTDVPRALIVAAAADGKSPEECQAKLDMGKPLLTARSDETGLISQTYDARLIEAFGRPHYCVLRFDKNQKCNKVEFIGVGASTEDNPL